MDELIITTKEILEKYQVHWRTVLNWRRGYYYISSKNKRFFFFDESHLEFVWNEELRRIEYNPIKVAIWVNRMRKKPYYQYPKRQLKINNQK